MDALEGVPCAEPGVIPSGFVGVDIGADGVIALRCLERRRFALTVDVDFTGDGGGGHVEGPSLLCVSTCEELYLHGEQVTLTAIPSEGARGVFTGWSGACSGTEPQCTVTMDQARAVTATFVNP